MTNIKLNSTDIEQAICDYINKNMGCKLDFLDYDYDELSIDLEKYDLYTKIKQGKKSSYRKVKFLTKDDPFGFFTVIYEGKYTEKKSLDLDYSFYIRDKNPELISFRVYKSTETPSEGSENYFDVDKEETAIKLSESLNKKDNCNSWCWSDSKSWEE